jgi:hypothetical protein
MERLTLEQAKARLVALAPEDANLAAVDFDNFETTLAGAINTFPAALEEGVPPELAAAALLILVAHQRHLDFVAGRQWEKRAVLAYLRDHEVGDADEAADGIDADRHLAGR